STATSSWNSMGTGRTRSVWRAETVRQILTAIHERALALADIVGVGSLSWRQSRHGLAVCRSFGSAGEEPAGRSQGHTADLAWPQANGGEPAGRGGHMAQAGHLSMPHTPSADSPLYWLAAVGVHSIGYLSVATLVALLVYERLGVGILRRAWFNLDLLWMIA